VYPIKIIELLETSLSKMFDLIDCCGGCYVEALVGLENQSCGCTSSYFGFVYGEELS
jgi:hypothetical protein